MCRALAILLLLLSSSPSWIVVAVVSCCCCCSCVSVLLLLLLLLLCCCLVVVVAVVSQLATNQLTYGLIFKSLTINFRPCIHSLAEVVCNSLPNDFSLIH